MLLSGAVWMLGLQTTYSALRWVLKCICYMIGQWMRLQFNTDALFLPAKLRRRCGGAWGTLKTEARGEVSGLVRSYGPRRVELIGQWALKWRLFGIGHGAHLLPTGALRFEAFNSWALRQRPPQLWFWAGDAPASGFLTLSPLMRWECIKIIDDALEDD